MRRPAKNIILTNYTIPQRLRQYIKHTQIHTDTHRLTQIVTYNDTRSIGHRLVTIVY